MRTVLADTQATVRRALAAVLTQDLGIEVVGEADTGDRLEALVAGLRTDLLIVDWNLIAQRGQAVLATLRRENAHLAVVVLSIHPEDRAAALAAGADAFVSKLDAPDQVVAAVLASLHNDTRETEGDDHAVV